MKIPDYPSFRPLDLCDKSVLDRAFHADPPENSEYTFTNLYSWRSAYGLGISALGDLIILAPEKNGVKEYYPPIGRGDIKNTLKRILYDSGSRFIRVPERIKNIAMQDSNIRSEDDRDNYDYLYLADDLINLKGRKYDGKRNFIKTFRSRYSYEYIQLTEADVPEVLRFQDIWCVEKGCGQSKSLQDESEAVRVMLSFISLFSLKAGALRVDAKICAVCIAEALNPETLVIHALKGASGMTGIYQTMFNEFLEREAVAYRYVNMEQDLGIPGLRKSKESYHPLDFVRKFSLSLSG